MDSERLEETLGDTGIAGVAVLAAGLLILARENRRAAVGALAVVTGYTLVAHGLVGSFLEAMGMDYGDLA